MGNSGDEQILIKFLFRYLRDYLLPGFFNPELLTFGDCQLLCWGLGGCPVHCRMLGSLPDFCSPDASSTPSLLKPKHISGHGQCLWGVKSPLVESHCFLFRISPYLGMCGICIWFL